MKRALSRQPGSARRALQSTIEENERRGIRERATPGQRWMGGGWWVGYEQHCGSAARAARWTRPTATRRLSQSANKRRGPCSEAAPRRKTSSGLGGQGKGDASPASSSDMLWPSDDRCHQFCSPKLYASFIISTAMTALLSELSHAWTSIPASASWVILSPFLNPIYRPFPSDSAFACQWPPQTSHLPGATAHPSIPRTAATPFRAPVRSKTLMQRGSYANTLLQVLVPFAHFSEHPCPAVL